jgi:two-component system chemotaxis response regulator CheY
MFTITHATRRVLVADDDPVMMHLVTSAIKSLDYEVVSANDGREAYRILQRDADFKAAVFDLMMPNLRGLDVIRFMRTEKRLMRIPTMMITTETDSKLTSEILAAGAMVFLPKPFTREQLQTTLRMLLSTRDGAGKPPSLGQALGHPSAPPKDLNLQP